MQSILNVLSVIPWYGWIGLATILASTLLAFARIMSRPGSGSS